MNTNTARIAKDNSFPIRYIKYFKKIKKKQLIDNNNSIFPNFEEIS